MQVAVTGATGFLGEHVCDRLVADGHAVVGTWRRPLKAGARLEAAGVAMRQAELGDAEALARAFDGCEVVFHVAALASYVSPPEKLHAVNVVGTRNVLDAARRAGARRVVHVSTESVTLQNRDRLDEDESAPLPERWLDPYSPAKAQAEREVLDADSDDLETTAVRAPWIWGERDTSVLRALVGPMTGGRLPLIGDGSNRITIGHAANVAAGLVLASSAPAARGRCYHVADEARPTFREFITRLCEACGAPAPRRRIPYAAAWALASGMDAARRAGWRKAPPIARPFVVHLGRTWTMSDARARAELGYEPVVGIDEGFERVRRWVDEAGGVRAAMRRR